MFEIVKRKYIWCKVVEYSLMKSSMMMCWVKYALLVAAVAMTGLAAVAQGGVRAAREVIDRWTGGTVPVRVVLTLDKDSTGCDRAECRVSDDSVVVSASSPTAACYAFYHWAKRHRAGICSWSGCRFARPDSLGLGVYTMVSPYRDHQYFNVVTYGYTMPYWDEERWDREIDWMALHGIDMPLMMLAQEAVYREVFKDMGLSDAEIDDWEVGPAHLPWMRMGNLSGNSFDGPLGRHWHRGQMRLARHVMLRMRALGMKPICPAFGGFVPRALADHYEVALDTTGWDWMPAQYRNYRVRPDSPLFVEIGARFVRKWESYFGKGTYYLSDSFNEMTIPADTALMARYGSAVYRSIHEANPEAVWVMQGWTLGYQRGQWGNGIFEALTSNVPRDQFYLLDMATDYNCCFWHNSFDWDFYHGFNGHPWVWSVIPNMGGKTAFTGVMDHYANGRLAAQLSPNRGSLTGFGMAPEGLENNEMIYELLCDVAFVETTESVDIDRWIEDYVGCRYGPVPPMVEFYQGLLFSVYSSFCDHPQFGWQVRNNIVGRGSVAADSLFCRQVERLMGRYDELATSASLMDASAVQLLKADLIEITAMYLSAKVEDINTQIAAAVARNDRGEAHRLLDSAESMLMDIDAILDHHPTHRLSRWEEQSIKRAASQKERHRNAVNARRIVSVWYGHHSADEPVNDYSCRLWSGLIRDYYLPRMKGTWLQKIDGVPFDQIAFENTFVEIAPRLSKVKPIDDTELIRFMAERVTRACRN